MLKLKDIHSHYGQIHALKGVSLEVKEGSICCLIGANGAGKSTTLMAISGIQRITSGEIEFQERTHSWPCPGGDRKTRNRSNPRRQENLSPANGAGKSGPGGLI